MNWAPMLVIAEVNVPLQVGSPVDSGCPPARNFCYGGNGKKCPEMSAPTEEK
jgi:hypothetical protein